jgi:Fe-S-cluster containining protein
MYREYYPSVEYGKIGVLLLPKEKEAIEDLASKMDINVRIVPRLAVGTVAPAEIIAYQMMGKNSDGDMCPFLDIECAKKSPHGGFKCQIYRERPLACRAYPVDDVAGVATLDSHCQFCKKFSTTEANTESLQQEIEALTEIKANVRANSAVHVWRYATGTGTTQEQLFPEGWVMER